MQSLYFLQLLHVIVSASLVFLVPSLKHLYWYFEGFCCDVWIELICSPLFPACNAAVIIPPSFCLFSKCLRRNAEYVGRLLRISYDWF